MWSVSSLVISEMSVTLCVLAPFYSSLCRGLEYLLEVRCSIPVDPLSDGFFFARFDCKSWNALRFCCGFLNFHALMFTIDVRNVYPHQTFIDCVWCKHTFWIVDMPDVAEVYGIFSV